MSIWNTLDINNSREYYYLLQTDILAFVNQNKGLILPNVPKTVGIFKFIGEHRDYPNCLLFNKPTSEYADVIIVPFETYKLHIKLLAEYVLWKN